MATAPKDGSEILLSSAIDVWVDWWEEQMIWAYCDQWEHPQTPIGRMHKPAAALGEQPSSAVLAPQLPDGYPEWFQRVYGYACTQTHCIVALSRCTPADYYHLVNAALRELGCEQPAEEKYETGNSR